MDFLPAITTKIKSNRIITAASLIAVLLLVGSILLASWSSYSSDKVAGERSAKFSALIKGGRYKQAFSLYKDSARNLGGRKRDITLKRLDEQMDSCLKSVSDKVLKDAKAPGTQENIKGLALFKESISGSLYSEFERIESLYLRRSINYDRAAGYFRAMEAVSFARAGIKKHEAAIDSILVSRAKLLSGKHLMENKDYISAAEAFGKVTRDDPGDYQIARYEMRNCLDTMYPVYLKRAHDLTLTYQFKAAFSLLNEALKYYPGDANIKKKIADYKVEEAKADSLLVPYKGIVEHIFFHPLIAYPEKAFDGDYMSNGYNYWFVTVGEFNRVIQSLYQNNYILIDINSLYEDTMENGKEVFKRSRLMLPKGKKPVIISVDDINYYEYMISNGNVYKLVLDKDGNVATYSKNSKGEEVISRDNEVVPILDKFVEKHPDFSFRGAKGTLGLTGYQGILGYRTQNLTGPDYEKEKEEALKVVKRLKETGWNFASHSYGHPAMGKVSYERLVKDTDDWKKEVEVLTGPTKIYIYPYGSTVPFKDPKFKYLYNAGFRVYCGVGARPYEKDTSEYIAMDRRDVDGYTLNYRRDIFLPLYDSNLVIDRSVRPPLAQLTKARK